MAGSIAKENTAEGMHIGSGARLLEHASFTGAIAAGGLEDKSE